MDWASAGDQRGGSGQGDACGEGAEGEAVDDVSGAHGHRPPSIVGSRVGGSPCNEREQCVWKRKESSGGSEGKCSPHHPNRSGDLCARESGIGKRRKPGEATCHQQGAQGAGFGQDAAVAEQHDCATRDDERSRQGRSARP